jgi:uncharacterized protein YndB with AHSA1/START domain
MNNHGTQVIKDLKQKSILVSREFNAPIELVWKAFTDASILDQWWGPAPWRAETKFQNFSEGGYWLYAMVSPEGEKHWGKMNYISINKPNDFHLEDVFCDEEGVENPNLPVSKGSNNFSATDSGTFVEFKMTYSSEEQLKQIIEMGFEQGITACLEQLNNLIINKKVF